MKTPFGEKLRSIMMFYFWEFGDLKILTGWEIEVDPIGVLAII